ncbi:MAG: hypothetical protein JSW25_01555 [Thermoplasmata archaeon]|nr:MAG: hypothetical protein JSW25_01555 [Thermoplasmata archaeon]
MTQGVEGRIRRSMPALVLIACLAVMMFIITGEGAEGALDDPEAPSQYGDWDHAYNLSMGELGTPLTIRKDGGGDLDFVRIPFLSLGDRVTIDVVIRTLDSNIEWWTSDPGRFPIWTYQYNPGQANQNPRKLDFLVTLPGPYWFHTGQGFGVSILEVNITVVPTSQTGDGNDRPEDAYLIGGTSTVTSSIGPPDDCSDFYLFHLAPSTSTKLFLTMSMAVYAGAAVSWELYNSTGILREEVFYSLDYLLAGSKGTTLDIQIHQDDNYYLRVWSNRDISEYRLDVGIIEYTDDGNDEMEGAQELYDGDVINGTIHTKYDLSDFYWAYLFEGNSLELSMDVDEDLDLYVLNRHGAQVASSDNWNDESELILLKVPSGGNGTYFVLVRPSTELDPIPDRQIAYQLRVVLNHPPEIDEAYANVYAYWPILEDRVDTGIYLPNLFKDPEGGPLTIRVVPGHDEVRLNATVTGLEWLRLEPAENVSGFNEEIVLEACDDHGKSVRFTVSVWVEPVNDGPVVGNPAAPPPPVDLEMDEDSTGGPWDILFWFWDSDNSMSELEVELSTGYELVADLDEMDRLRIRVLVPDWNGLTSVTVLVRDPEGLEAAIAMPVLVLPVNDPPVLIGPDISMSVSGQLVAAIDVASSFFDVDGDDLTYRASSEYDLEFTAVGSTIFLEGLLEYQHEEVTFLVDAYDPSGYVTKKLTIVLEIGDVPESHMLSTDVEGYTMVRGRGEYFVDFTLTDPDEPPTEYIVYLLGEGHGRSFPLTWDGINFKWYDGAPYWVPWLGDGTADVEVTLYVADEFYNVSLSWKVHVREFNSPPEILGFHPDSQGPYRVGDSVTFLVEAIDQDNDTLTYTWYVDGRRYNTEEAEFTITAQEEGEMRVRVEVHDGFDSTNAEDKYTVWRNVDDPMPPDWTLPLFVVALMAVVLLIAVLITRRAE